VRACHELDLPYSTRVYDGPDPLGFMIALNRHRRHVHERQRAMIAATLANMRHGGNRKAHQRLNSAFDVPDISLQQAADLLNVSRDSVVKAAKVRREAAPELVEAVEQGRLKVHTVSQTLREAEVIIEDAQQPDTVGGAIEPDAEARPGMVMHIA
jgi:hypothetical protein